MSKIGIITFHRASNYGAVLQAYALQTALEKTGVTVNIIDHRCFAVEQAHNPAIFFKKGILSLHRLPGKIKKYSVFNSFRSHYLKLTEPVTKKNLDKIAKTFDIIVAGSDQLWNDRFAGGDTAYFLPFSSVKKYTYAVSIGDKYDEDLLRKNLIKYGSGFNEISLRENTSKDFVEKVIGRPCRVDIDPTFLLSKEEWNTILSPIKKNSPYILIYTVAEPDKLLDYARKIGRETNMEVIYLNSGLKNINGIKKARFATPSEFLGWIYGAQMVLTNSFHGTAFSIIMNKQFWIEDHSNRGKNIRGLNLLQQYGLEDRVIEKYTTSFISEKRWQEVNKRIISDREISNNYLQEITYV